MVSAVRTELWFWLVGGAGLLTLLLGAYIAMFQNDLKRVLAYSTVSHLGLITLLFGLNSALAAVAAVFHILNHGTFKASLFMAAGIVDHETGTRDIRRSKGLLRAMPITGTLALVASAAMAGVPLLNCFLSKEMFFAEAVILSKHPWVDGVLPIAATLAGIFAVVYSLRFSYDIFFGAPATNRPRAPEEPPRWMRIPVDLLVLACLTTNRAAASSRAWSSPSPISISTSTRTSRAVSAPDGGCGRHTSPAICARTQLSQPSRLRAEPWRTIRFQVGKHRGLRRC